MEYIFKTSPKSKRQSLRLKCANGKLTATNLAGAEEHKT